MSRFRSLHHTIKSILGRHNIAQVVHLASQCLFNHIFISLVLTTYNSLNISSVPLSVRTSTLLPVSTKPLIRLLRHILIQNLPLKLRNMVARQIIQRIFLIGPSSNRIRNCLDIVANLLVDVPVDICDLGIFDAVFVTVVGVDLRHCELELSINGELGCLNLLYPFLCLLRQ